MVQKQMHVSWKLLKQIVLAKHKHLGSVDTPNKNVFADTNILFGMYLSEQKWAKIR